METGGDQNHEEKEGIGLLGEVHYEDIGNGRVRCVETGHEMPSREVQVYGNSKSCRLALIDCALADKKAPLNFFEQNPEAKYKLICKLTGDMINKTEEHVWKHISGRKFQHKLVYCYCHLSYHTAQKEAEREKKCKGEDKCEKGSDPQKIRTKVKKHKNVEIARSDSTPIADAESKSDSEEPDFWTPPVGKRWDFDNGKDRWEGLTSSKSGQNKRIEKMVHNGSNNDEEGSSSRDGDAGEVTARTKRLSIAVGPSSFASRKKKSKVKAVENGS